jgi:hypothetical protein
LETVYKKGYDRKKIENLFSNLEFTQLYDRTFDIPDFGVSSQPFKKETKFNQSSKSHVSSKSRERLMKESSSGASQSRHPLTHDVLHPEKFLM